MDTNPVINPGAIIGGRKVAETGVTLMSGDRAVLVPVKFVDGKYAIVQNHYVSEIRSRNDEVMRLIEQSEEMPIVRHGIGSDVWHVYVKEKGQLVLIKKFYNDKNDRPDEVHRQ